MRVLERADREDRKRGGEYTDCFDRSGQDQEDSKTHAQDGHQFPAVVRPRFRGFRFPAEDCSAFATVGEFVSPPLRLSCAFCIEGVDDPAGPDAVGLGACACCGVPFALSVDDDGGDADGALCGIVAGVI